MTLHKKVLEALAAARVPREMRESMSADDALRVLALLYTDLLDEMKGLHFDAEAAWIAHHAYQNEMRELFEQEETDDPPSE